MANQKKIMLPQAILVNLKYSTRNPIKKEAGTIISMNKIPGWFFMPSQTYPPYIF